MSSIPDLNALITRFEQGRMTRRELVARIGAFAAGLAGAARVARAADPPAATFQALELNHIALNVTDVARSTEYYRLHLGMTPMGTCSEQSCFLRCGPHFVALFKGERPGLNHYCFTIDPYDPAKAVERLQAAGITARRTGDRVYFDDPDGIELQVAGRGGD